MTQKKARNDLLRAYIKKYAKLFKGLTSPHFTIGAMLNTIREIEKECRENGENSEKIRDRFLHIAAMSMAHVERLDAIKHKPDF